MNKEDTYLDNSIENSFQFSELITQEEIDVLNGIKNGMYFDPKTTNKQLYLAQKLKNKNI